MTIFVELIIWFEGTSPRGGSWTSPTLFVFVCLLVAFCLQMKFSKYPGDVRWGAATAHKNCEHDRFSTRTLFNFSNLTLVYCKQQADSLIRALFYFAVTFLQMLQETEDNTEEIIPRHQSDSISPWQTNCLPGPGIPRCPGLKLTDCFNC